MSTNFEFDQAYARLNPEQKQAVDTIDGPVMVIAGPGTGKTQVLSLRVGNILRNTDIAPGNILCLTFTDAAAVNMRERLAALIGPDGYRVAVHTFHSFAREIISSHPEYFYEGADFIAADELAQLEIFEEIFSDLSRGDPLRSSLDGEYTYLSDAKHAIGLLKKAAITPDEFEIQIEKNAADLAWINPLLARVFDERMRKQSTDKVREFLEKILARENEQRNNRRSLLEAIAVSLGRALKEAHDTGKTTPLSAWKTEWTRVTENGERVHKDTLYLEKMRSLARVYRAYRERMRKERYYDFDDMLLDVVSALREHVSLLSALQERYQYILVDEFQDTNDAQLRLVELLGSAPVNEGRPNIMIVGDDDQAIYRFQGAEISNILDFPKRYAGHKLVVLTKNYRSTQDILDVAREVIEKSSERLTTTLPALEKRLIAERTELQGHIYHAVLGTRTHEYAYIAREITQLIKTGHNPKDIAVITRRHRELEDLARVLVAANIPVTYERKQNVFDEPHIRLLLLLARFVSTIVAKGVKEGDEYLPDILSAPVWGFSREDVWRVSVAASRRDDRSWLGAMTDDTHAGMRTMAAWLIDLGIRAPHEPLERILDEFIGSDGILLPIADEDMHDEAARPLPETRKDSQRFRSPFRQYYFGKEARKNAEARYLLFLSSLRVLFGALREFRKGKPLFIRDLVEFADLHERNGITLADTTPFASAANSVSLLTAHKAKGLEFDTVFVASCQEEVWAGRGYPNKLPFPMNLRDIELEEGGDDRLRTFYVALTRARKNLYVTAYRQDDSGKASMKVRFVAADTPHGALATHVRDNVSEVSGEELVKGLEILPPRPEFFPIIPGERAILLELIKDYRMSVTHLNNFLNVAEGGPAFFLEQNLLRFPQAMRPAAAYGDAMHKAIERFYREHKKTGKLPKAEQLINWFGEWMSRARMTEKEYLHFLHAGEDALAIWYELSGKHIPRGLRSEVDFKNQGVVLFDVPLTGKIDKIVTEDDGVIHVTDFKTGRAKKRWEGKDARERILLHGYKRQLTFYKLLVEHSHEFRGSRVERATLEFIEPADERIVTLDFAPTAEDTDRLSALIAAVYRRIIALDFPDTEKYSKDLSGIIAFEEDLLS